MSVVVERRCILLHYRDDDNVDAYYKRCGLCVCRDVTSMTRMEMAMVTVLRTEEEEEEEEEAEEEQEEEQEKEQRFP